MQGCLILLQEDCRPIQSLPPTPAWKSL